MKHRAVLEAQVCTDEKVMAKAELNNFFLSKLFCNFLLGFLSWLPCILNKGAW